MGWSCRYEAAEVIRKWTSACLAQTGMQNEFWVPTIKDGRFGVGHAGTRYFWELSRKEHNDGAITGSIVKIVKEYNDGSTSCKFCGSFRIEGDGIVTRAPKFLKNIDL